MDINLNLSVVKIGGSCFDTTNKAICQIADQLLIIHKNFPLILNVGGGELLSVCLRKIKKYERSGSLTSLTIHAMNFNCYLLSLLLKYEAVRVIESGRKDDISESLSSGYLPIVPFAKNETFRSLNKQFFPNQSDMTTALLAEEFQAKRCVFVKNLPGICSRDPNSREKIAKRFVTIDKPININEEKNDTTIYIYKTITIDEVVGVISKDHVIEKKCIEFIRESKHLKEIFFVSGRNSAILELFEGKNIGTRLVA